MLKLLDGKYYAEKIKSDLKEILFKSDLIFDITLGIVQVGNLEE